MPDEEDLDLYLEYFIQENDKWYGLEIFLYDKEMPKSSALVYRSSHEENPIEFEVLVNLRTEAEWVLQHPSEIPSTLKESIVKVITDKSETTFTANPYFDEVMIFFGLEMVTSTEHYAPYTCSVCNNKEIYKLNPFKENKKSIIEKIKTVLENERNPNWPFKGKIHFQFSVSDIQSKLDKADLDNYAKTILDSFNNLVYQDDRQVSAFVGYKEHVQDMKALVVAFKQLDNDEKPQLQQFLFSSKANTWQDDYKKKRRLNKGTRFRHYMMSPEVNAGSVQDDK